MKASSGRTILIATLWTGVLAASLPGTCAWADPIALKTPSGLQPGDTFRFAFVTTGTRDATSTEIADYNAFVNTEAGGATYGESVVTWKAVASTGAISARDNVGGFGTNVPIYLVNGALLAGDLTDSTLNKGLWSWELFAAPGVDIHGQDGVNVTVATGSGWGGETLLPLGDPGIAYGFSGTNAREWIFYNFDLSNNNFAFYGISSELTAIPEPSSCLLAGLGLTLCASAALRRRRTA